MRSSRQGRTEADGEWVQDDDEEQQAGEEAAC